MIGQVVNTAVFLRRPPQADKQASEAQAKQASEAQTKQASDDRKRAPEPRGEKSRRGTKNHSRVLDASSVNGDPRK